MNAHVNLPNSVIGDTGPRRACTEWPAGYRLIGPIAAFLVLALGTAQWVQSGSYAPAIDVERLALEVGKTDGQLEYFPAQYTNQAKEPEEHIQAF